MSRREHAPAPVKRGPDHDLQAALQRMDMLNPGDSDEEWSGTSLKEDSDFETIPTPLDSNKRPELQRIEVNAKSLELLIHDLGNFLERAEQVSAEIPTKRDPEESQAVGFYLRRLHGVLSRLYNDVVGNNYHVRNAHTKLAAGEISTELRQRMQSNCQSITETMAVAKMDLLVPAEGGSVYQHRETFPFFVWLKDIQYCTDYLNRYFSSVT
ncbi:MAG: hypothetical protein HY565_03350 [Candidatus Kerfeldbacteria bacterium]|nr:hypothetical protein [Candidatus Kerfeldbacteria bacterium]